MKSVSTFDSGARRNQGAVYVADGTCGSGAEAPVNASISILLQCCPASKVLKRLCSFCMYASAIPASAFLCLGRVQQLRYKRYI